MAVYNSEVPTPTKMVETVKVLADDVTRSKINFLLIFKSCIWKND